MTADKKVFSHLLVFLVGLLLLIGCTFMGPTKMAVASDPVNENESSLQAAGELYTTYCLQCHGATGLGDGPRATSLSQKPADLTRSGWKPDVLLALKVRQGNGVMPAWKNTLSDDQISSLIKYIRNFESVAKDSSAPLDQH